MPLLPFLSPAVASRAGAPAGAPLRPAVLALDALLETSVVGSFSRVGYLLRHKTQGWTEPPRVDGKVMVVTGASSGIGRAVALALGRLGATVWSLGRDPDRTSAVAELIRSRGGHAEAAIVDVADAVSVDAFAQRFALEHACVDGLVHAAGALLPNYQRAPDGSELTVATHVLGPYRLSSRLATQLRAGRATIVTMSSGGMYTERFELEALEMRPAGYDGVRAYARAKRAQVLLAHEWSRRWGTSGVASYATHPGWADTPGLAAGLPSFARLGPLLRTADEGADTALWLVTGAAQREAASALDDRGLWFDRRRRSEYRLPWTRPRAGAEADGRHLWDWCASRTGLV